MPTDNDKSSYCRNSRRIGAARMRKISELLEICKRHHELWGGSKMAMCFSAVEALKHGEMTLDEFEKVKNHSMELIDEIDQEASYLFEALGLDRTREPDRRQLKDWWENHIKSLKEKKE